MTAYFPDDVFYDFLTHEVVRGTGANVTFSDVEFSDIPVHIRGGSVVPLRIKSAMTTTALRLKNFELVVALGLDETASGRLYVDDGVSITQKPGSVTDVGLTYKGGVLQVTGRTGAFTNNLKVDKVTFLGIKTRPKVVLFGGAKVEKSKVNYDEEKGELVVRVGKKLNDRFTLKLE